MRASGRSVGPGGVLDITVPNQTGVTYACVGGGTVRVESANNDLSITGHCTALDVTGDNNDVTVGSADQISVAGTNNDVTYQSGTPQIQKGGINNDVHAG